jgi:hypothetical protein
MTQTFAGFCCMIAYSGTSYVHSPSVLSVDTQNGTVSGFGEESGFFAVTCGEVHHAEGTKK